MSNRLYFGFESRDGFNLALPEKALLDAVYFRHIVPFADDLEMVCWMSIVCARWPAHSRYG